MRIFNLSKEYNVVCTSEGTRYGFRHLATLHRNGFSIAHSKVCYYNRTWEYYEFETVLRRIINDNFEGKQKAKFLQIIQKGV